jgi:hypothetical protein
MMTEDLIGHPLAALRFRREAVSEMMAEKKVGRREARRLLEDASDAECCQALGMAVKQSGVVIPPELAAMLDAAAGDGGFAAIGDGKIIQAIKDFFAAHPEIVKLAVQFLIMLISFI